MKKRQSQKLEENNLAEIDANEYSSIFQDVAQLIESGRRISASAINAIITATYWKIGAYTVNYEQEGKLRADYGKTLLKQLSEDLSLKYGRGFSRQNIQQMRKFYLQYPPDLVYQTVSSKLKQQVKSNQELDLQELALAFPLSWSHYTKLFSLKKETARIFYERESLRGGWTVRQLSRQIGSQFYERTLLSKNKAAMLKKGSQQFPEDTITPEEQIKDPFVLEFLNLKDEYSENDMEEALISHLEKFLLELGNDFTFMGRQKRLRIGNEWYRIDLLFFHRSLRCLVIIDLKLNKLNHSDAGQMHMYLNYAKEHWTHSYENPPVGLILCAQKEEAFAHYALEGLPNKILAAEYQTKLPDEETLVAELDKTQRLLEEQLSGKQEKKIKTKALRGRESLLKNLVQEKKRVTTAEYIQESQVSRTTAYRDLVQAVKKGWLKKHNKGKEAFYTLS